MSLWTVMVFIGLTNPIEFLAVMLKVLIPSAVRFTVADQVVDELRATTWTPLMRMEVLASLVPDKVSVVLFVTAGTLEVTTGCEGAFVLSP